MSRRRYIRTTLIITLSLSCIHLGRKDPYIEGIISLQSGRLQDAKEKFLTAAEMGDSVEQARRHLIKIYRLEGDEKKVKEQCLLLLRAGFVKSDIIDNLSCYYEKGGDFHNQYMTLRLGVLKLPSQGRRIVDRQLLAQLMTGLLCRKRKVRDPIGWVVKKGYLKPMPDGNFYPEDTVRIENLAIVLAPYLPEVDYYQTGDLFDYALAKLDRLGLSAVIKPSDQPLKLKTAIIILDRVKGYLK